MKAKNKLALIMFPAYDWAISKTHPEREERLLYTQDQLKEEGVFDIEGIDEYKPLIAKEEDVLKAHFCFPDVVSVTTDSHMISAGGAMKAAQLIMEKKADRSFAIVRPPGHHAMKVVHGNRGFCNINNEAIMIEYLRDNYGIRKIAVVDTDCHHGDGTQDIYWHDPNVLFISMHQDGRTLFPGTGFLDESGGAAAIGRTINIPLPPNTSDEGFIYTMEQMVLPILQDFQPEIIINSAGQDNHYSDPITDMNFSAIGYAMLNEMLKPDIAVLEGGYAVKGALPYVNLGIILAMAGLDYSHVREPGFNPEVIRQTHEVGEYIKSLTDTVLNNYFELPGQYTAEASGEYIKRKKQIFYDTDNIVDYQLEYHLQCGQCAGLLKIETESSKNPLSLGIEIPYEPCSYCYETGVNEWERARQSKQYKTIQLINKKDKHYVRHPRPFDSAQGS